MGRKLWAFVLFIILLSWMFWGETVHTERAHLVPEVQSGQAVSGNLVIDLRDGSDASALKHVSSILGVPVNWVHPLSQDEALAVAHVPNLLDAQLALRGDPLIEVVEPSVSQVMFGYPNDPLYSKQWHLDAIGAQTGWAKTPRGQGIIVAVLDTGVTGVEDLAPERLLEGVSFVAGESDVEDKLGHGTHVAGTIGQSTHNSMGTAGVAPECLILPVKVLSSGGAGTSEGIAAGIDYAADNGASVINLSLGGAYSEVIHLAIKKARKRGVIVVAAAGNSGRRGVSYPGALSETIGVAAVGPDGQLAPYSSWGKGVDIAAPGGDTRHSGGGVLQNTVKKGSQTSEYLEFQGTSMATPHVAGAAAVLLSMGLPPGRVEHLLMHSANGTGHSLRRGHGTLDLSRAIYLSDSKVNASQFLLANVLVWILCMAGNIAAPRAIGIGLIAGLFAGGAFFLDGLPLYQSWWVQLMSQGFVTWPRHLFGPWIGCNPLWLSALVPLVVTFVFGVSRSSRAVAVGVVAGFGTQLFYGAATGTLEPSLIPTFMAPVFLALNATVCVLLGLALVGMDGMEEAI